MGDRKELKKGDISFASGSRFVESMRHQGLSEADAIKELIDNSLDAQASNIWVEVWSDDLGINILVQDDGSGMTKDVLGRVPAFGETNNDGISNKIGRFGFGLPTAVASRTKYAEIYSRTDNAFYYTVIDLDGLEKDPRMKLPEPGEGNPETEYFGKVQKTKTGTVVVMLRCDRLNYKKPEKIADKIKSELEQTYRIFIHDGKKMHVNGKPLGISDPLMLLKGHRHYEDLRKGLKKEELTEDTGYSKQIGEIDPISIQGIDEKGNNCPGFVRIKLVLLPIEDIDRTGGAKKYGVGYNTQGFYLMRNGRQIAGCRSLRIVAKHPMLTHFRGEIDFDSCLDDAFGIQVNKSRFDPTKSITDKVRKTIHGLIPTLRKEQQKRKSALNAIKEKDSKLAEEITQKNILKIPKKTKLVSETEIKEAIKEEQKKIDENKALGDEQKENQKKDVRDALENRMPFILSSEDHRNGPIYTWVFLGKTTKVTINRDHPFYDSFWVPSESDTYQRTILKMMVFALVKGEQYIDDELEEGHQVDSQELQNFISQVMRKWLSTAEFKKLFEEEGKERGFEDFQLETSN